MTPRMPKELAEQLRDKGARCIISDGCSGPVTRFSGQGHGLCSGHIAALERGPITLNGMKLQYSPQPTEVLS